MLFIEYSVDVSKLIYVIHTRIILKVKFCIYKCYKIFKNAIESTSNAVLATPLENWNRALKVSNLHFQVFLKIFTHARDIGAGCGEYSDIQIFSNTNIPIRIISLIQIYSDIHSYRNQYECRTLLPTLYLLCIYVSGQIGL